MSPKRPRCRAQARRNETMRTAIDIQRYVRQLGFQDRYVGPGPPSAPVNGLLANTQDGDQFSYFSTHHPLRSTGFHRLQRYYEVIRLLGEHRRHVEFLRVVYRLRGPDEIS